MSGKPKIKRNVAGFWRGGLFHPIRSPKFVGADRRQPTLFDRQKYDRDRAGDNDDVFDREIRKTNNLAKAEENWQRQVMRELEEDSQGESIGGRKSLLQFVRSSGGIRPHYKKSGKSWDAGELSGLTFKQSKKKGIAFENGKYLLPEMWKAAREAGYPVGDTDELINLLEKEIRTGKKTFATYGAFGYKENPADLQSQFEGMLKIGLRHQKELKIGKQYEKNLQIAENKGLCGIRFREDGQMLAIKKNPAKSSPKKNGIIGRYVARTRAANSLRRELRHEYKARSSRAKKEKAIQRALNPALKLNPAKAVKIGKFWQIRLSSGDYLKGFDNKIWKSVSKKNADGLAKTIKLHTSDELSWLHNLKQNPFSSATFFNLAGGLASALHVRKMLSEKPETKEKTIKRARKNPHYGWFDGLDTAEQVKQKYKDLAKRWHPDKQGGDLEKMQSINAEFDAAFARALRNESNGSVRDNEAAAIEPLREAIEFAVTLPDTVKVTIRGLWLWLEGGTFHAKDKIKSFQSSDGQTFKFAPKKKAWFFAAVPSRNRGKEFSFAEIENLYGSQTVKERKYRTQLNPRPKKLGNKFEIVEMQDIFNGSNYFYLWTGKDFLQDSKGVLFATQNQREAKAILNFFRNGKFKLRHAKKNPASATSKMVMGSAKKNPVTIPRRKVFEMFQGRPATSVRELPVSIHAPNSLDQLGELVEIKLADGRTLHFLEHAKKENPFVLCASPRGKRLWIAGGKFAKSNPSMNANDLEVLSEWEHVIYGTYKPHLGDFEDTHYIHPLGEETGVRPLVTIDRDGFAVIYGGDYTIEDRGIVN